LLLLWLMSLFLIAPAGCDQKDGLELKFPKEQQGERRIPPCLREAIRLCTQKDPDKRPHDIDVIIQELEKFATEELGSKRRREQ